MENSFIHTQILVHLHVNKTNFHIKRLRTRTRFETEAKGNSEIASFLLKVSLRNLDSEYSIIIFVPVFLQRRID